MSRCEKHDLEIISCADCRPRPGYAQVTAGVSLASETGRWFIAAYRGTCSGCGEDIEPDDEIRADRGGWARRECCGESGHGTWFSDWAARQKAAETPAQAELRRRFAYEFTRRLDDVHLPEEAPDG